MTVSPSWPQDGNRQPPIVGNGVESDETYRSPTLPPTLFQLPNLNPAPQGFPYPQRPDNTQRPETPAAADLGAQSDPGPPAAAPLAESTSEVVSRSSATAPPPTPAPPPVKATAASPEQVVVPSVSKETKETTPDPAPPVAPPSTRPAPQSRPASEQPAGRLWMEHISSHGAIVALLLVVVAAALITGRGSQDKQIDASLAESGELLDFDDGTEVNLPPPLRQAAKSTEVASSAQVQVDSSADHDVANEAARPTESVTVATEQQAPAATAQGPSEFSVAGPKEYTEPADNSVVSLDAPDSSSQEETQNIESTWSGAPPENNRIQFNEFMGAPTTVDARPAANRVETDQRESILPSLEDLADEPTMAGNQTTTSPSGPSHLLSRTPAGVKDWSQYIPNYEPAAAVGTVIPTTSK